METMRWKAWLVYDKEGAERNAGYIRMHEETGRKMQIDIRFILDEQLPELPLLSQEEKPDFVLDTVKELYSV